MHEMTLNWPWTLNSDRYSLCTKDLPLRLKLWSTSLCEPWFSRYKVLGNQNYTEWPQNELGTLNSQKYFIYTRYLPPGTQILVSFALQLQGRQKYKVVKNWKSTERPQTELEHLTVKSILYTLRICLWGPNSGQFRPMTSGFKIQGRRKS